jgi:hypothetical protein
VFDLFTEVSGLIAEVREHRLVLLRIAEALERLSPPLPLSSLPPSPVAARSASAEDALYMAESPEEYQARTSAETALAVQLGIAPWSPDFQQTISQFKSDLQKPIMEKNEEGGYTQKEGLSSEEAEDLIKKAFKEARAQENFRRSS